MKFSEWLRDKTMIYVDLDNTLINPDTLEERPGAKEFLEKLKKIGSVYILTHGHSSHQKKIVKSLALDVPVIGREDYDKIIPSANAILIDDRDRNDFHTKDKLQAIGTSNFVQVKSWESGPDDELIRVLSKVEALTESVENNPDLVDKTQPFNDYKKARKMAEDLRSKFKNGLEEAAGGNRVVVSIKKEKSFDNKTEERGKRPNRVFDVLRGAILVEDEKEIEKIVSKLKKLFEVKKIERKEEPTGRLGYYGSTHVDVVVGDMVCEIQIMTKKLWEQKQETDKIYQKYRGKVAPQEEISKSRKLFRKANND